MDLSWVKAEARKKVRKLLRHSRIGAWMSLYGRESRTSCSWSIKRQKTMLSTQFASWGLMRFGGKLKVICHEHPSAQCLKLQASPWFWECGQIPKCIEAFCSLPAPTCLSFVMPLGLNQMPSHLAPSPPMATRAWNRRIIQPAHASVLLQVSGFHGYNTVMDTAVRQWKIGW